MFQGIPAKQGSDPTLPVTDYVMEVTEGTPLLLLDMVRLSTFFGFWSSIGVAQNAFLSWLKALLALEFQDIDLGPCFNKGVRGEQILLKLLMNLL